MGKGNFFSLRLDLCLEGQTVQVSKQEVTFLCPRDDSQGALRFAPVCPSVCLSVRPFGTLYGIEFVQSTPPTVFSGSL